MPDEPVSFSDVENGEVMEDAHSEPVQVWAAEEEQPSSFWAWLRGLLSGPAAQQRLDELNEAVTQHPQAASNYVLRGEVYRNMGEYDLAAADFERALMLAAGQFEQEAWGLLSQTMRDQAEHGLEQMQRKLARTGSQDNEGGT